MASAATGLIAGQVLLAAAWVGGSLALLGATWLVLKRRSEELEQRAAEREAMLRLERQSLAGLFVGSLTHDANNVVMVALGAVDLAAGAPGLDPLVRGALGDAERALQGLSARFEELHGLSRRPSARREVELVGLVERVVAVLRGHARLKGCRVKVFADGRVTLPLEEQLFEQLLVNLVMNAAEATDGRGAIEVRVGQDGSGEVQLEVHDDGPGVPDTLVPRLFRAMPTAKPHGTGIGLLCAHECAKRHSGKISYQRSSLGGACFVVRLAGPAVERSARAAA